MKTHKILIENAAPATGTVTITAPYDGADIAQVETSGSAHVEQALSNAYALYSDRDSWLDIPSRIAIFEKAIGIMQAQAETLALDAAREGGKPLIDSRVEVARAIDGLQICIETLRTESGDVIPMNHSAASLNHLAFTQREPIGVVVAVSAFNHPLNLIVHQVAAALAAGCPFIVKPADDTPLSCIRFVEILHEAGLPLAWGQVVIAENLDVASELVMDKRLGFFSFIGSAKVGWMLRSKLAPGVRCALEHGGAAPVIVAEDADIEAAVAPLSKAAFYHAGQVCVSTQRIFAHRSVARHLAEKLVEAGDQQRIGDPTSENTDIGPLIRHRETTRVHEWVEQAVSTDAELMSGGKPINESCYPCTVLFNPAEDALVSKNEIFGPVVCVYEYDDIDNAIKRANDVPFSFQAAIYTKTIDTALRCYKRLNASAVMVNEHTAFRIDAMPFAGLKESGLGVGGIPHTIADMQVSKMAVIKSMEV